MNGHVQVGKILIKLLEVEKKTKGGVLIPNMNKAQRIGECVIGGKEVSVGDKVVYTINVPMPPVRLIIEGEEYWLMRESEVLYIF